MEAEEIHEFIEQQEEAGEKRQYAVSFSISVLAVLVALATVGSHRQHTAAVLEQARASDTWALYQARRIRDTDLTNTGDLLAILAPNNPATATKAQEYAKQKERRAEQLKEDEAKARELEAEVDKAERKAGRFDLGEALLQIAVVLASVTLLTRQRIYWLLGITLGAAGFLFAASALLVR